MREPRTVRAAVAAAAIGVVLAGLVPAPATPAVAAAGGAPALTPGPPDALTRLLDAGRLSPARYALERAAALFDLAGARARFGAVARPEPRSATLVLRDLAARLDALRGADERRAEAILARPTDGRPQAGEPKYSKPEALPRCDGNLCVHYVSRAAHPRNAHAATPAFARRVLEVAGRVWRTEVDAFGYRAPKQDLDSLNHGGDGRLDVYLADVGAYGLFGYCTTDDPNGDPDTRPDVSTYCVLDNDYVGLGYADPAVPLKVTAAHELFHAVQAAYDWWEDGWFMEGTATWIEDEVFDGIDDNVGYLRSSPLTRPLRPLDRNAFPGWYGTWVWFRFLAEQVGDRRIVRDAWEAADGSAVDPNRYSTEATVATLPAWTVRHNPLTFGEAFAAFGAANVRPDRTYDEGRRYPRASTQWSTTITTTRRSVAASAAQDHLTNRYARIRRGAVPGSARLLVVVDAPPARTDPHATLVVVRRGGGVRIRAIALDRTGAGRRTVAFGRKVAEVVVVTTNASTRFVDCGGDHRWRFSCAGTPLDDGVRFTFVATLLRGRSRSG